MGFVEIDENTLKQVKQITLTNYENIGVFVPIDAIQPMIEDLLHEIERLEEQLENQ